LTHRGRERVEDDLRASFFILVLDGVADLVLEAEEVG
jgi:hypothetical protein